MEQTQTAGNGDINDTTSKLRQTIRKLLISHGFITPFVSATTPLTTTGHESGLINLRATSFGPFIATAGENIKVLPRDGGKRIGSRISVEARAKLICNS